MNILRFVIATAIITAAIFASFITTDNFIDGIASGIISGLIASISLILIMAGFQPRIRIAPFILIAETLTGGLKLSIKIVNKTGANLIEPKAAMHFYLIEEIEGGNRRNAKKVTLINSMPMLLKKRDKSDPFNEHVYIFNAHVTDDVKNYMRKYTHIRFRIVAKHPSSGAEKVFEHIYSTEKHSFRSGRYKTGDAFVYADSTEDRYSALSPTSNKSS
ncbi:MAG: hypothetical protein ABNH53_05030 [Henriciella sp.]